MLQHDDRAPGCQANLANKPQIWSIIDQLVESGQISWRIAWIGQLLINIGVDNAYYVKLAVANVDIFDEAPPPGI